MQELEEFDSSDFDPGEWDNLGIDKAVRLGNPEDWKAAAELD